MSETEPMLQNICLYCTNHKYCGNEGTFDCESYEPVTPNNECPDCGFLHAETLPIKCNNCGREFPKNQSILIMGV